MQRDVGVFRPGSRDKETLTMQRPDKGLAIETDIIGLDKPKKCRDFSFADDERSPLLNFEATL